MDALEDITIHISVSTSDEYSTLNVNLIPLSSSPLLVWLLIILRFTILVHLAIISCHSTNSTHVIRV